MTTRRSCIIELRTLIKSYPTLRHLHSFPTRRSSDLWTEANSGTADAAGPSNDKVYLSPDGTLANATLLATTPHRGGQQGGDRKSTRLNSSHVSISYAVFCLKKKNILDSFRNSEYC